MTTRYSWQDFVCAAPDYMMFGDIFSSLDDVMFEDILSRNEKMVGLLDSTGAQVLCYYSAANEIRGRPSQRSHCKHLRNNMRRSSRSK